MKALATETTVVTLCYLLACLVAFELLMPIQLRVFPGVESDSSLLFLPHGVKVLAAWLLGWRASIALFPGVFLVFLYFSGASVLEPPRIAAMAIAVLVPSAVFHLIKLAGWDLSTYSGRRPRWASIMFAGFLVSVVSSVLSNLAFQSPPQDYFVYLIGDFFGLFFLSLILMFLFRALRKHQMR